MCEVKAAALPPHLAHADSSAVLQAIIVKAGDMATLLATVELCRHLASMYRLPAVRLLSRLAPLFRLLNCFRNRSISSWPEVDPVAQFSGGSYRHSPKQIYGLIP